MKRIGEEKFDLLILDIMMPKKSGYDICREIREQIDIPILMVTAKTESVDKIRGLGLGADDYIVKPFDPMELVARVKSHLLRYERLTGKNGTTQEGKEYDADDYCIEIDHIPAEKLFDVINVLGIQNLENTVTFGYNLISSKLSNIVY